MGIEKIVVKSTIKFSVKALQKKRLGDRRSHQSWSKFLMETQLKFQQNWATFCAAVMV
jgi:hypothetical protein